MKITDLLSINTIDLNGTAKDKTDVIKKAVKLISKSGAIKDVNAYQKGVFAREKESTTGVGEGIAIPHCKSKAVAKPALAAMIIKSGVDYNALDNEPVHLLFLIAAPNVDSNVHLEVLARLSNLLMHEEFKNKLLKAKSKKEFIKIIDDAESEKKEAEAKKVTAKYPQILAATSCPTGVAHTYMAQEALEKAAKELGYTIKVETNGTGGAKNVLTEEEIAHAEVVIVAADAFVETSRFTGKKMIEVSVSRAIKDASGLIKEAYAKGKIYKGLTGSSGDIVDTSGKKKGGFHTFYRHLMAGISHMIPFVIAGGICLAIAYLIDGCCGVNPAKLQPGQSFGNVTIAAQIFHFIGADFGLGLMLPVLGGFIAYSIAGKPGLVAGFIGAFAAKEGRFSLLYFIMLGVQGPEGSWVKTLASSSSGFLGAIIAGFMAGYLVLFLIKKTEKMPRSLAGVKDMLLMPLFTSIIVSAFMLVANVPLAFVNIGIATGLKNLANIAGMGLLLGALAGGLMAIDMGGPINKATHFAIVGIVTASLPDPTGVYPYGEAYYHFALQINAANLLGMLTPPAGIALATWLFPQKFTKGERNPSIANLVTGCCGITEGAIPYVVKNPITTIVSTVVGAACGGMISMTLGFEAIAPEGGFIGMVASNPTGFWRGVIACAAGALITCVLLGILRKNADPEEAKLGKWKGIPIDVVVEPIKNGCLTLVHSFKRKDK